MKVRDVMRSPVICVGPGQTVESAAKVLERYRIGALPVCTSQGMLCGMVTDRDLVVRCLAMGKVPSATCVREIMTKQVICVKPDMEAAVAAHLMGRKKVRRLPVVEDGKVKGIVSLDDLAATEQNVYDAADALGEISATFRQNRC